LSLFIGKIKMPVTMKLEELQETVARGLLVKMFQPYTGSSDGKVGGNSRRKDDGVEFNDFAR
jgi:hypothetical protein